ncbi:hypothetical protein HK104_008356 [Borealophlyctis nickersoniae]|nr:hypothetical protein HK104_008356 [Borealophlyctis nickersoniae]
MNSTTTASAQSEAATTTLIDARSREAELGHELKELARTLRDMKEKHSHLPTASPTTSQHLQDLETRVGELRRELGVEQREHDERIRDVLERRGSR